MVVLANPVATCPRCQQSVPAERIACRSCGAVHHPECWVHGRGCGYYACGAHPGVLPPPAPVVSRGRALKAIPGAQYREPIAASFWVGVMAAIACLVVGLIACLGRDLVPAEELLREHGPALVTAALVSAPASLHVHDLAVELSPLATSTIAWSGGSRAYAPVFRFGRDTADRELPVIADGNRYSAALPVLEPGASYAYRIGGLPGGGAVTGRITALPPSDPPATRLRTQMLDLPDGIALEPPSFGPQRFARPLWVRESGLAGEVAAAGSRVLVHDGRHATALDATDGTTLWTHPVRWAGVPPRPVLAGNVAVLASTEGPVGLALDSGKPLWKLPLEGLRALFACGDEVYALCAGPPARLFRMEAASGRMIAILPMPEVPHEVALGDDHVVVRMEYNGAMTLRVLDRLRGERRWERLFWGADFPAMVPVIAGDRMWLVYRDRVEARALANGSTLGRWSLPAAATGVIPMPDGGALVGTGGDQARLHRLTRDGLLVRSWNMLAAPRGGVVAGDRAAIAGAEGVEIVELTEGPRWGVSAMGLPRRVALTAEGHLVAQGEPLAGTTWRDRIVVLGLSRR